MALGAGIEYFVTSNVAVGLEMKYIYTPGQSIAIGSNPARDATISALLFSLSLRAFLLDFPAWKPTAPASSPSTARAAGSS